MKKILSSVAAIALAAALISCGDSGDTNNTITNSDTIISVGTPVVTGKAYPGVNYITWTPVANADHYEVYRTVNNASKLVAPNVTGTLEFADYANPASDSDFALVDGVTYQYTIYAVGANGKNGTNVPSRAVYIATSTASTYVKAVVPAYGTDVTKFDDKTTKDYLAKLAEKKDVTAPALIGKVNTNYNVSVAYPVIPGYKYGVKLVNETKVAAGIEQKKNVSGNPVFNGTYTANAGLIANAAGKYTAYLTVAAISPLYPTEAVYSLGDITIADIGEMKDNATKEVVAKWASPTSIRVTWTPAKLAKNNDWTPTTNYKVYRSSSVDNHNTVSAISATVTKVEQINDVNEVYNNTTVSTGTNSDARYVKAVKYQIIDSTIKAEENYIYRYYIVHTDGTYFGTYEAANNEGEVGSVYSAPKTKAPTLTFVKDIQKDAKSKGNNTIKITAKKNADAPAQTLKLYWLKLDEEMDTVVDVFAASWTELALSTSIGTANYAGDTQLSTAYLEDRDVGTYLLKLTASETGKSDNSVYVVCKVDALGAPIRPNLSAAKVYSADATNGYKGVLVQDSYTGAESASGFTYTLYSVTTTTKNKNYTDYVEIKTSKVDGLELKKVASDSELRTKYGATIDNFAAVKTGLADYRKVSSDEITDVYYYVAVTYAGATAERVYTVSNAYAF